MSSYAFHCMGGLANQMLQTTFAILLTSKGKELFLTNWRYFEFPSVWSRQQNPITHLNSYYFSDYFRLIIIMPFLLNRAINISLLKDTFVNNLITTCNLTQKNQ
ncbi:12093_t:CDS:1, partial [Rhizophagus irregularis]